MDEEVLQWLKILKDILLNGIYRNSKISKIWSISMNKQLSPQDENVVCLQNFSIQTWTKNSQKREAKIFIRWYEFMSWKKITSWWSGWWRLLGEKLINYLSEKSGQYANIIWKTLLSAFLIRSTISLLKFNAFSYPSNPN